VQIILIIPGFCLSFLEKEVLARLVEGVVWYTPTSEDMHRYGDGGVAIIDQWIASHAKFFTGKW
jgi:peptide-O-fucosyltransferase